MSTSLVNQSAIASIASGIMRHRAQLEKSKDPKYRE